MDDRTLRYRFDHGLPIAFNSYSTWRRITDDLLQDRIEYKILYKFERGYDFIAVIQKA